MCYCNNLGQRRWQFGTGQWNMVGFGVNFEGTKLDVECETNGDTKIVKCSTYFYVIPHFKYQKHLFKVVYVTSSHLKSIRVIYYLRETYNESIMLGIILGTQLSLLVLTTVDARVPILWIHYSINKY